MSGGVGPSGDILLKEEEPKHDQQQPQHQPLPPEAQQKAHIRRGIFSFQQLNALAVAVVLSASGMVAVEDFAFVIFSFFYMYFMSKVAFPTLHPSNNHQVFDDKNRLLRVYSFVGVVVGLILPVAYIFEGILEGDKEGIVSDIDI
ncbi:hypothetical protein HanRHA438_Chr15g0732021 [Helianthus annuus]|nr:hypothetical protein HanHA300_Chr15g0586901 [Helianthus annuus]KAJ0458265.1 hypothetical protein HanIR_Chr15g0783141 [Helianthus annuus]KAJ0475047.1 hypothetical protein HanHA89_Chr15g0636701 [Helianthus annuus]KAJ0650603.1 hypothetical protein HanLR1_Chr15g0597621 [Helianthus annuus]KAJ0654360.1 hypothetical protein HanOQP8_Chr15g0594081 [Helianthus annuus]